MKINIKTSLCCLLVSIVGIQTQAQVGIGVATPNSATILDLTNTNNKGVLMPISTVNPFTLTTAPEGMFIYYNNGIYVKQSTGFNAINPWTYKFNGNTTEDISFNPSSLVGVGIGVNTGGILGHLHISDTLSTGAVKQVSSTGNSAALFIGSTTAASHMIFDGDEIMAKSSATAGGILKLQEEDGSIQIGSNRVENVDSAIVYLNTTIGSSTINKKLTVHGSANVNGKVQESGNDLLPVGSIIMWSGTTVPAGWALCNGNSYPKTDGSGNIPTPNLQGRSIKGTGAGYTVNTTGGSDNRTLTTANLPAHTHSGNTANDGSHNHTGHTTARADNDDNDTPHNFLTYDGTNYYYNTIDIRNAGSNHTHAINNIACNGCSGNAFDNRPAYYVLTYIMKL